MPTVICLDMEGVLVPEIWIHVARKTRIPALRLTTRDIPDYDRLMRHRLQVLKEHRVSLKTIQGVIAKMRPLPGAKRFLKRLRARYPVILLSDTFYEFAMPLMRQLGDPTLFCNELRTSAGGRITGYRLRQPDGKRKAVRALKNAGFRVHAAGDSYNDISMLKTADRGVLFNAPAAIAKKYARFPRTGNYGRLLRLLTPG